MTRYLKRWKDKNGLEDLQKGGHFLAKFIEEEEKRHKYVLAQTEKFMRENPMGYPERIVFIMLANYGLGDLDRLYAARDAIARLIDGCEVD